jgi:hypothetical protein
MRCVVLVTALCFAFTRAAFGAASPPLTDAEKAFIAKASATIDGEYPTTATAKSAGFILLVGGIFDDNTYDWTNMSFTGVTPDRPNFLWFDRHGNIAGVDWQFPQAMYASAPQPAAFPVRAARWVTIRAHVHYAYTLNGKMQYGVAKATPALNKMTITADMLRANGAKLPENAKLVWAMYHPAVWDLAMWTVPNPNGAFADKNPNVK